jgi:hypothetical protein
LLSASSVALTHERVAATTPDHDASLSVAGGTASTPFNIILPPGASCSGSQGYRWETFIATSWLDVSTWLYFTDGPNQPDGTFTSSLRSTTGEVVKARLPAAGGLITGIPQLNLLGLTDSGITNGTYNVGIFCANRNPPGVIGRIDEEPFTMRRFFWEQLITVSDAATMTWTAGCERGSDNRCSSRSRSRGIGTSSNEDAYG